MKGEKHLNARENVFVKGLSSKRGMGVVRDPSLLRGGDVIYV